MQQSCKTQLHPFRSLRVIWFLLICAIPMISFTIHGQGTVLFSNLHATGAIADSLTGEAAQAGTIFKVALYFAPDGITDASQFAQIGAPVGLLIPGYFAGGILTAPVMPPGSFGMFQVRVWESLFGSTYEEAVSNSTPQNGRLALVGESGILRVDTGDPTVPEQGASGSLISESTVAVVGAPLRDGFVLTVVPEPSPALLFVLGLPALLFLRNRRTKPRCPVSPNIAVKGS